MNNLKQEFEDEFGVYFIEGMYDFFASKIIEMLEGLKEDRICSLKAHPDGIDCYGQRILTIQEYRTRGINTEPICKKQNKKIDSLIREFE